jgi:hypothetical protein
MTYQPPAIESRQSIEQPFVLGTSYIVNSPSWTEKEGEGQA